MSPPTQNKIFKDLMLFLVTTGCFIDDILNYNSGGIFIYIFIGFARTPKLLKDYDYSALDAV
jgi:hypothetical protein